MATNQQVRDLRAGDVIVTTCNGRTAVHKLTSAGPAGQVSYERSKAYGHWFTRVEWETGTGNGWVSTSVQSDENIRATGYRTHAEDGERLTGFEVLHKADESEHEAAKSKASSFSKERELTFV